MPTRLGIWIWSNPSDNNVLFGILKHTHTLSAVRRNAPLMTADLTYLFLILRLRLMMVQIRVFIPFLLFFLVCTYSSSSDIQSQKSQTKQK